MIEKLKEVKIEDLSKEEVLEHRESVLKLDEDGIVEYLTFAIDTQYNSEEEGDNAESVDLFFDAEEFKPFYDIILKADEEATETTEESAE